MFRSPQRTQGRRAMFRVLRHQLLEVLWLPLLQGEFTEVTRSPPRSRQVSPRLAFPGQRESQTHLPLLGYHLAVLVPPAARVPSPSSKLAQVSSTDGRPPSTSSFAPAEKSPRLTSVPESSSRNFSKEKASNDKLSIRTAEQGGVVTTISSGTPTKEKRGLFSKSPASDAERKEGKQPNKLRKKMRVQPTSGNASAQSSTNSLPGGPESPSGQNFYTPMPTPGAAAALNHDPLAAQGPTILNTQATPTLEQPPRLGDIDKMSSFHVSNYNGSREGSPAVKAAKSPVPSLHSRPQQRKNQSWSRQTRALRKTTRRKRAAGGFHHQLASIIPTLTCPPQGLPDSAPVQSQKRATPLWPVPKAKKVHDLRLAADNHRHRNNRHDWNPGIEQRVHAVTRQRRC